MHRLVLRGLALSSLVVSSHLFANANNSTSQALNKPQADKPLVDKQQLATQKVFIQTINQCKSTKRLAGVMNQALLAANNDAQKAQHASLFEEIMLLNPSCALQALNALPAKKCQQFEQQFINETFFVPRSQIIESLASAPNFSKSCVAI